MHNIRKTLKSHRQPRIINLTNKQLTVEQVKVLSLGPQYAIEINPKKCINNIIIETENAIRCMEPKWQNFYRFQAKISLNRYQRNIKNPLHRHQQSVIKSLKMELSKEDIIIMKDDKNKTLVLIDKNQCKENKYIFKGQQYPNDHH